MLIRKIYSLFVLYLHNKYRSLCRYFISKPWQRNSKHMISITAFSEIVASNEVITPSHERFSYRGFKLLEHPTFHLIHEILGRIYPYIVQALFSDIVRIGWSFGICFAVPESFRG